MFVSSISFFHFRNLAGEIALSPGLNVFFGGNGQGKTNVLEAVYLACYGRSFRGGRLADLVRFGEESAAVELQVTRDGVAVPLSLTVTAAQRRLGAGGRSDCTHEEALEHLRVIFFGPEDLDLVKGSRAVRRDFLDDAIALHHPPYLKTVRDYQRLLKERNQLLRDFATGRPPPGGLAEAYEKELARAGGVILAARFRYLHEFAPLAVEALAEHSGGRLELAVQYDASLPGCAQQTGGESLAAALEARLAETRAADIGHGSTTVGPHVDDLDIAVGGRPARFFASQGEQRLVAVSFKIAQLALWRRKSGTTPVLLLDDVMSELDADRGRLLLRAIRNWQVQTLVSTTAVLDVVLEGDVRLFEVVEGRISHAGQGAAS